MVRSKQSLLGFIFISTVLGCWNATPIRAESGETDFDYRKDNPKGPQFWGDLKKEWSVCKTGKMQSPIEIQEKSATKVVTSPKDLIVDYKSANATIKNNEHAISVIWDGDAGSIQINDTKYLLKQCHWHHPSEHIIDGKKFDLELHMVHQSPDQKLAVIGFLYQIGQPNGFITKVTNDITSITDVIKGVQLGVVDPMKVKMAQFEIKEQPKKADPKFYRYMGSLTTPPCAEGVVWHLSKEVQTVSVDQVELLREAVFEFAENNARPTQPLNGREIKLYDHRH